MAEFADQTLEDLTVAVRHFEDLEVFVGQRSRMHPGPGWALVLQILRADLAELRRALGERQRREGTAA